MNNLCDAFKHSVAQSSVHLVARMAIYMMYGKAKISLLIHIHSFRKNPFAEQYFSRLSDERFLNEKKEREKHTTIIILLSFSFSGANYRVNFSPSYIFNRALIQK